MKTIRIGNDFVFAWAIERNGIPEDLSAISNASLNVRVFNKIKSVPFQVVGNSILIEFTPLICDTLGVYNLEFSYDLPDTGLSDLERKCSIDIDAFQIVPKSAMADVSAEFVVTSDLAIAFKGDKGDMADVSMTIDEYGNLIATIYN